MTPPKRARQTSQTLDHTQNRECSLEEELPGSGALLGWHAPAPRRQAGPRPSITPRQREALRREGLELASRSGPFEWADVAWDLCDEGRPEAAAEFWRAVLELYDCDARVHLHYADSLQEAGRTEAALKVAQSGYELAPDLFEFQEAVLDLLFALGHDETDFEWQEPVPSVVRLDGATRERIRRHLVEEGECDLFDLRYTLFDDEFLCFDVEELACDLERNEDFEVCRFEGAAYVSLRAAHPLG